MISNGDPGAPHPRARLFPSQCHSPPRAARSCTDRTHTEATSVAGRCHPTGRRARLYRHDGISQPPTTNNYSESRRLTDVVDPGGRHGRRTRPRHHRPGLDATDRRGSRLHLDRHHLHRRRFHDLRVHPIHGCCGHAAEPRGGGHSSIASDGRCDRVCCRCSSEPARSCCQRSSAVDWRVARVAWHSFPRMICAGGCIGPGRARRQPVGRFLRMVVARRSPDSWRCWRSTRTIIAATRFTIEPRPDGWKLNRRVKVPSFVIPGLVLTYALVGVVG